MLSGVSRLLHTAVRTRWGLSTLAGFLAAVLFKLLE
jgi:hypothetical protein